MPTRSVTLTEDEFKAVDSPVASGCYDSAEDVVGEVLHLLVDHKTADDAIKLARLQAKAQIGLDDLNNGHYLEFSGVNGLIQYLSGRTDEEPPKKVMFQP